MIDSHCHLDFDAFDADRDAVAERARRAGVEAVLVPGVDAAQWRRAAGLRAEGLALAFAAGVHPQAAGGGDLAALEAWIDRLDACAIGELGWDAHVEAPMERQDAIADAQLELARARGLPVILHVVGAHGHALERLARHGPLPAGGVVHAYSGSAELVARYVRLNLHVAMGPSVLREKARRPLEAARAIPAERLLLETDGPDQRPPDAARGEPAHVARVAEAVATARGEEREALVARADANARRLFGLR